MQVGEAWAQTHRFADRLFSKETNFFSKKLSYTIEDSKIEWLARVGVCLPKQYFQSLEIKPKAAGLWISCESKFKLDSVYAGWDLHSRIASDFFKSRDDRLPKTCFIDELFDSRRLLSPVFCMLIGFERDGFYSAFFNLNSGEDPARFLGFKFVAYFFPKLVIPIEYVFRMR